MNSKPRYLWKVCCILLFCLAVAKELSLDNSAKSHLPKVIGVSWLGWGEHNGGGATELTLDLWYLFSGNSTEKQSLKNLLIRSCEKLIFREALLKLMCKQITRGCC